MMWLQKVTRLMLLLLLACVAITRAQKPAGTSVKVCPFGQPIMTSSNTPLACLTDVDCDDATYRCVQRPRYTTSKVCCKVHRKGKKTYKAKPRQKREQRSPRW